MVWITCQKWWWRKFLLRIPVCYLQIYSHLQRIPTVDHGHGWAQVLRDGPAMVQGPTGHIDLDPTWSNWEAWRTWMAPSIDSHINSRVTMAQVGIEAPVAVPATNEARSVPLESLWMSPFWRDLIPGVLLCSAYWLMNGPEFNLFIAHHFWSFFICKYL